MIKFCFKLTGTAAGMLALIALGNWNMPVFIVSALVAAVIAGGMLPEVDE